MSLATNRCGVANWQQADRPVLITIARQHSVESRMTEGRNDRDACGLVLIENDGGQVKAMLVVE